ncbi:MAG: hypothetical protein AAGF93_12785 [Cyanobacteria bacterium P01_H01_bin.105]
MAKFCLPKWNSWVTPLVLASIGLHGLVMALPMPDLADIPPVPPELPEPDVIQVVTLPKLAKIDGSPKPPLPEPPPEEPPPVEEPVEELVVADPEILEEIAPEPDDVSDLDNSEWEEDPGGDDADPSNAESESDDAEPTLDQRLASYDSYSNYDGNQVGDGAVTARLSEIIQQGGEWPSPFRELEQGLSAVDVPLQDCLEEPPGKSVSFRVEVGPDGALLADPEPLNSAGYDVLDEKALEIARAADYAAYHPAGETKAYSFAIQIDYEACNVASLTNTEASG